MDVHLPGSVASAPASLNVRITIQPDSRNRWGCFGWQQVESGAQSHSGCWSIEGVAEAKTSYRLVRDLPAGEYVMQAWIIRNDETRINSIPRTFKVIGPTF